MYKIKYETLAIMVDGSSGNVYQGGGTCYSELSLDQIENELNNFLAKQKRKAVILSLEKITGFILNGTQHHNILKPN